MSSRVESEEGSSAREGRTDDRTKRRDIELPLERPAETPVPIEQVPDSVQPGSKEANVSIGKWRLVIQAALLTLGESEPKTAPFEALDNIALANSELSLMVARLEGKIERTKVTAPTLSNLKETTAGEKPLCAAITRRLSAPKTQIKDFKIREPRKLLILKSKDNKKSVDQAREVLSRALSLEKVQIKQIKKRKDASVVEVNTEKDLAKFKNNENVRKYFLIERPKRRRPRMIVHDVSASIDKILRPGKF